MEAGYPGNDKELNVCRRSIGAVVIGRNEGERLCRCLQSLGDPIRQIVYVDSGSTDESVPFARSIGVEVVELDVSVAFTAARARNAGLDRLVELDDTLEYVHFFDGDCEVVEGWIETALDAIEASDRIAIVSGRLIERYPEKTIYNLLCDLEWKFSWPYGEVELCGGIALMRIGAMLEVGGFDPALIAGEEPELCLRLRNKNWIIYRVNDAMSLHDAAMTRFSQWWRRAVRGGHAYAEGASLHGRSGARYCVREIRSIWFWGLLLPSMSIGAAWITHGWSLVLLAGYPVLAYRIYRGMRKKGSTTRDAWLYSLFCAFGKFPGAVGQLLFYYSHLAGKRTKLIEHK